jgi:hypothetical protein
MLLERLRKSPVHALFFLLLLASCTSGQKSSEQLNQEVVSSEYASDIGRDIAQASQGISTYPTTHSFKLSDFRSSTYTAVLKSKIKPALDKLSAKSNGGGGGWKNISSLAYKKEARQLNPVTLAKYKGARWNRNSRAYEGALPDEKVVLAIDTLTKVSPVSSVDSITYYEQHDKEWYLKNDMAIAMKEAGVKGDAFNLATLYTLTGGLGVKVKIDDNNYNYHVLYKTGKTNPHREVMSGRSFASSPGRAIADATHPEYLRDLSKFLKQTKDKKPFYRALVLSVAASDPSGWSKLSPMGQLVLSDFFTVYTAEALRHMMVNLQNGMHPWEIDLATVTFVSSLSSKLGKVVQGGQLVDSDLIGWFAPSPNNVEGGPQRSGIGITRRDRKKFQRAIHQYEMDTPKGKALILKMQSIVGNKYNKDDIIQAVFEYLSNVNTPQTMGANAQVLADTMAQFIELATEDAEQIANLVSTVR